MPRFFIDTSDDRFFLRDEKGFEFPDLETAKSAAVIALSEMARDALPGGDGQNFLTIVRGEDGAVMLEASLAFRVTSVDDEPLFPSSDISTDSH